jgi:hypothetical protein
MPGFGAIFEPLVVLIHHQLSQGKEKMEIREKNKKKLL